jgi:hypothetical protein
MRNKEAPMPDKYNRPKEIIDYCLKPLALDPKADATQEVYRRFEHVIKTYQSQILRAKQPIEVDFSQMRTLTINEDAHGHD